MKSEHLMPCLCNVTVSYSDLVEYNPRRHKLVLQDPVQHLFPMYSYIFQVVSAAQVFRLVTHVLMQAICVIRHIDINMTTLITF
jgi:hypothetical protein